MNKSEPSYRDVTKLTTASKYSTGMGEYKGQFKGGPRMLPNKPCPCGSKKKYKHCCLNKGV